jgi:MFS family permease
VRSLVPACIAFFAFGVGSGTISILIQARIQLTSEKRMLGRVMSILMLGVSLVEMGAYAISGALADLNPRYVFLLSGITMAIASLIWKRNEKRRLFEPAHETANSVSPRQA